MAQDGGIRQDQLGIGILQSCHQPSRREWHILAVIFGTSHARSTQFLDQPAQACLDGDVVHVTLTSWLHLSFLC